MEKKEKIQRIIIISIVCAAILIISLIAVFRNTANSNEDTAYEEPQDIGSGYESASTEMGKTVEEAEEENEEQYENAEVVSSNTSTENDLSNTTTSQVVENTTTNSTENTVTENTNTNTITENNEEENVEEQQTTENVEEKAEVTFTTPVKGQILREFATDSLVYSNTLEEWITHNGIDIKADKTSVVSAAAPGKVYAIKNDPRYGLTVIIDHDNGYRTIYSNLLTSEFVVEGEEVEQGQSIGTVGNSATFEICDDYHLHFELLKDNQYLDPTIYINFE